MNGKQKFLGGSVLSIQDSSFAYPACQNCFSRVIHTSSRIECPRCGYRCTEPSHRYKLSMKVADGCKLYIITVFGRCLDPFFGIGANSLQRHLEDSVPAPGRLAGDQVQELMFRAVDYCFVGRSFLFGVKVPVHNHDPDSPQHMIASQITLPNDGPNGRTVIQHYNQLLQSFLEGSPPRSKPFSFSSDFDQSLMRLSSSESSSDVLPDENQAVLDFWPKSFALTSSSLVSSQSPCGFSRNRGKSIKSFSLDKEDHVGEVSQPGQEDITSDTYIIPNTSTPKSSCVSISTVSLSRRNSSRHSPLENTLGSPDFPSTLLTKHVSWNSESCPSQGSSSCSAGLSSKNTRTAGSHQDDGAEVWEDLLFSESLSDLIARVEKQDTQNQSPSSACKQRFSTVTNHSDDRHCTTPDHVLPQCVQKVSVGLTANKGGSEHYNRPYASPSRELCKLQTSTQYFSCVLNPEYLPTEGHKVPVWSACRTPFSVLQSDPIENLYIAIEGTKDVRSVLNDKKNCVSEHKSKWAGIGAYSSAKPHLKSTGELYNTSADLFETSENIQTSTVARSHLAHNYCVHRDCGGFIKKQCIPLDLATIIDTNLAQPHEFLPYLQSTPLLKNLSRSPLLTMNKRLLNKLLHSATGLVFTSRRSSGNSLRSDLLKKMSHSLLERKSPLFCGIPWDFPLLKSPTISPFQRHCKDITSRLSRKRFPACQVTNPETPPAGILIQRRKLPMKLLLEDKENINEQTSHEIHCDPDKIMNCKSVTNHDMGDFTNGSLDLSPITSLPFPPAEEHTNSNPFADWSPELFAEKSNSQQCGHLQRRLF
ncbi:DNA damage-induced apoptosis suppressor protein [Pelodytes ibericus]